MPLTLVCNFSVDHPDGMAGAYFAGGWGSRDNRPAVSVGSCRPREILANAGAIEAEAPPAAGTAAGEVAGGGGWFSSRTSCPRSPRDFASRRTAPARPDERACHAWLWEVSPFGCGLERAREHMPGRAARAYGHRAAGGGRRPPAGRLRVRRHRSCRRPAGAARAAPARRNGIHSLVKEAANPLDNRNLRALTTARQCESHFWEGGRS